MSASRIALLFEYPTLNGGERSMLAVLDALRAEDDDRRFVAIAPESGPLADALQTRGIEVVAAPIRDANGRRWPPEKAAGNLQDLLLRLGADLMHANSLAMGRLTGAMGDRLAMPRVAHLRDIVGLSAAAIADLNRNDALLAVSNATRDCHVSQGLDANRVHVVYNGIDCEAFQPRAATGELKRELGLPADAFLVLSVGQIGLRKGQDVLAEAAIRLCRSGIAGDRLPELHFVVVGERNSAKAESVAFEQDLQRRFEDAGLTGRLHRLGYRSDVPRLMNESDLLVHAAHQEPLGRVLLEAAAAGLPIVATNVGGTPEIVDDGLSARLVPADDPAALAAAIAELAINGALRSRLAGAARRVVETRFPIAVAADALADVWRRALAGR